MADYFFRCDISKLRLSRLKSNTNLFDCASISYFSVFQTIPNLFKVAIIEFLFNLFYKQLDYIVCIKFLHNYFDF